LRKTEFFGGRERAVFYPTDRNKKKGVVVLALEV